MTDISIFLDGSFRNLSCCRRLESLPARGYGTLRVDKSDRHVRFGATAQ